MVHALPGFLDMCLGALNAGFGVGLYGFGSKIQILDRIQTSLSEIAGEKGSVIRVAGYRPDLSPEQLVDLIARNAKPSRVAAETVKGKAKKTDRAQHSTIDSVKHGDSLTSRRIYLLVDSFDARSFASYINPISTLTRSTEIRVVATIDSAKAYLLLGQGACMSAFHWQFFQVNTNLPYEREAAPLVAMWKSMIVGDKVDDEVTTAQVIKSLTKSHGELLQVLAAHQVKRFEDKLAPGIKTYELLDLCKSRLIATNLPRLNALLNELLDHQVVASQKDSSGNDLYVITLLPSTVRKLAQGLPLGFDQEDNASDADASSESGSDVGNTVPRRSGATSNSRGA